MSFAQYFRVKAELYELLLEKGDNSAVDRAWYEGLVRSYRLLAASEDRHYFSGLKAIPSDSAEAAAEERERGELENDIAVVVGSEVRRSAA